MSALTDTTIYIVTLLVGECIGYTCERLQRLAFLHKAISLKQAQKMKKEEEARRTTIHFCSHNPPTRAFLYDSP